MKLVKKITATVTALAMAVSIMSIGASALNFNLHQHQGAPTSSNVIFQKLEFDSPREDYVSGYCNSFSLTSGTVLAELSKKVNGSYVYKASTQISGTGNCSIYNTEINYGSECKVTVEFMNPNAYGQVTGSYS